MARERVKSTTSAWHSFSHTSHLLRLRGAGGLKRLLERPGSLQSLSTGFARIPLVATLIGRRRRTELPWTRHLASSGRLLAVMALRSSTWPTYTAQRRSLRSARALLVRQPAKRIEHA